MSNERQERFKPATLSGLPPQADQAFALMGLPCTSTSRKPLNASHIAVSVERPDDSGATKLECPALNVLSNRQFCCIWLSVLAKPLVSPQQRLSPVVPRLAALPTFKPLH